MIDFGADLHEMNTVINSKAHRGSNLSAMDSATIRAIRQNPKIKVVMTDKNLGPAVIDTKYYYIHMYKHLSDGSKYIQLSEEEAIANMVEVRSDLENIVMKHDEVTPEHEQRYFGDHASTPDSEYSVPCAYLTIKLLKDPMSSRLIVALTNSRMAVYSRWCDVKLQLLLQFLPTKFQDSYDLKKRLLANSPFPPKAKLATFDIDKYYPNIRTEPALQAITWWITTYRDELPADYPPTDMVIDILRLVMNKNIFTFDDTYWQQKEGAAIGTNAAPPYGDLNYGYHEVTFLFKGIRRRAEPSGPLHR